MQKGDKIYVKAPEGCCEYLTEGNVYRCYDIGVYGFNIIDDEGEEIYCRFKDCGHLNGKDWIIVEQSTEIDYAADENETEDMESISSGRGCTLFMFLVLLSVLVVGFCLADSLNEILR